MQTIDELKKENIKLLSRLNEIEAKNKCLRVQFFDWLSDKLLDWSNRVHEIAAHIHSPCVIKVEPRKKEESKSAKENKELARMRELLAKERNERDQLAQENKQLARELSDKVLKEADELLNKAKETTK